MPIDSSLVAREAQQGIERLTSAITQLDAMAYEIQDRDMRTKLRDIITRDIKRAREHFIYLRDIT